MAEPPEGVNSIVLRPHLRHSRAMRMTILFAGVLFGLAACAPLSIYYKPGVSVTRLEQETTTCQVAALKDAPVATQIRQEPPRYIPGRIVCDGRGYCYDTGPYWIEGRIYTVDVNESLRVRLTDQCMANKGFTPARIPQCPAGVSEQVPPRATTTLPPLTPDSCVIKYKSGGFQIVNVK